MMDLISFPDHSRIWIYASDREIEDSLVWEINTKIYQFSQEWISHQKALRSTGGLLHAYFLVLVVDQQINQPGGCSIDTSVRFIQELGTNYNLNFFNRDLFYYLSDGKVKTINRIETQLNTLPKEINEETLFFDNLVSDKLNFQKNWLKPLKESWHSKFIKVNQSMAI
ncbi:MAG: hypothetical protein JNL65_07075 [Saprospiraceae bacterium]|nr:hypothetical protein [Saprospiraceae bacterium]HRG69362.1 hypothetical protein [Saprospiraceae bacterium]